MPCLLPLGDNPSVRKALNGTALEANHHFALCLCTILVKEKYTRPVTLQLKEATLQSLFLV